MPLPQIARKSEVVEYFLDCAQEAGELDAGSAFTLRLYGDDEAMMPIAAHPRETYRERQRRCLDLAAMADAILPQLPPERRAGLVHHGLQSVVWQAKEMAECFAGWAISDAIEGGCMLPFRDKLRSRRGVPFKRTMARLRSPKFIRRYVKSQVSSVLHLRALAQINLDRAAALDGPARADKTMLQEWRDSLVALNGRRDRRIALMLAERHRGPQLKRDRRMVVRSLNMAVNVLGRDAVSAFLRGEEVRLVGAETILAVRKRGALTDVGHGCLSVALLSRDGAGLADLCTFVDKTPTLDQLTAFALWMAAGDDRGVLANANIIDSTPEGREHPLLVQRAKDQIGEGMRALEDLDPATADRIAAIIARKPMVARQLTREQEQARNELYFQETTGHWMEATFVLVFGYRNFPTLKAAKVL